MRHAIIQAVAQLQRMYPAAPPAPWTKVVLGLLIGTAALAALFYALERLFPEQQDQPAIRAGTKTDAMYWVFDFLIARRLVTVASIIVLIAVVALRMPRLSLLASQPLWLQAVEALLLADFCGYWSHRAMHEVPTLWRVHKLHHSSERLDWLAAARVHPLESIFSRLVSLLPLFLLGFSPKVTMFFGPVIGFYPIFLHSNVRWGYGWAGYLIASPAFHRWHHSADREAINRNYSGLLPVFDFVFGTAYFPRSGKPARYGLPDEQAPVTFWQQLRWPFQTRGGVWIMNGQPRPPAL